MGLFQYSENTKGPVQSSIFSLEQQLEVEKEGEKEMKEETVLNKDTELLVQEYKKLLSRNVGGKEKKNNLMNKPLFQDDVFK
jgi:hypothetical protein